MSYLSVQSLSFAYEKAAILEGVSFAIKRGESVALVGDSGGGKSTLLRLIAGLEKMQEGDITLDGNIVASKQKYISPQERNIGLVFQSPSLFPHLTVERNIAFGVSHIDAKKRAELVQKYAEKVGVEKLMESFPSQLSGGQQQRVALARALIRKPALMLFDEPFSSLDLDARTTLRTDVKSVLKKEKMTSILVTHDATEAEDFSDRVLHLKNKKILE